MKYVALLRGINVGGNSIIKMLELKDVFEKNGFTNVKTLIQSGNVIFETDEKNAIKLTEKIEALVLKTFHIHSKTVVRTFNNLQKVVANVPNEWKTKKDIRCYVAFIKEPVTVEMVIKETKPKEGIDSIKAGPGVMYMTTLMSGLTKSGFSKLTGNKYYKDITIRNYTTVQKLLFLMQ